MTMKSALVAGMLIFFQSLSLQAEENLRLADAIRLALQANDPSVQAPLRRRDAEQQAAIAAEALPDPTASISVRNLPVDDFDLDREAMTQIHLGVRQQFPRGNTRSLMKEGRLIKADEQVAQSVLATRTIVRNVSAAWFQLQHSSMASSELETLMALLDELRQAQENNFAAAGDAALQKIYRTELEAALVQDRLTSIVQGRDAAREVLARYIGPAAASRPVSTEPVTHPKPNRSSVDDALELHPMVLTATARSRSASNKAALAKEAYKPQWGVELGYGARYGDRSDFASAMVTFDLPFWTGKRQDPALRAAKQDAQGMELGREALLLDLKQQARTTLSDIANLEKRISRFEDTILPHAENVVTATRNAYGAGDIDFSEMIRAEIALVDSHIRLAMLHRDLGTAHANLAFLTGDPS